MKTVFLIVLSAFYAENGAFLMAFHNFKSISHRFSKRFQILFYLFCRVFKLFFDKTVIVSMDCNETRSKKRVYYKAKEASDYYEVKPS